jgi:Ni/Fe-hydrogenase subunit HybB-like protein
VARPRVALTILAALAVSGVVGIAWLVASGAEPRAKWGYVAATAAFVLSACQLAPVVALISRLGRGAWGIPLRTVADLYGVSGLVSAPLLIVVLFELPEWRSRPSIWFDWPGAPLVWDAAASIALALAGVALAWLSTWRGGRAVRSVRQWRILASGLVALGALYAFLAVFVHLLVASDLGLSLVPGWHSAVIPAYHAVSGLQAALALVVLTALGISRFGPDPYARPTAHTLNACARLLLALSLLWFYFVWCELLTYWYGRTPDEQMLLQLFMFGPGSTLFVVTFLGSFAAPVGILIWNAARRSTRAITAAAAAIVVGCFVDRLRLYVSAWSVATPLPTEHLGDTLPPLPAPGAPEVIGVIGALATAALLLALLARRARPVSAWEP